MNDADGNFLKKICAIIAPVNGLEARSSCESNGYTLFRIDSAPVQNSFLALLDSTNSPSNSQILINGAGLADGTWEFTNPTGPYPFMTIPAEGGECLALLYNSLTDFSYLSIDCQAQNPFGFVLCEKLGC